MVVTLTHAIPALILYYPVFLLAAAFIIKFRLSALISHSFRAFHTEGLGPVMFSAVRTGSWLELLGLNPDGRAGRGLVWLDASIFQSFARIGVGCASGLARLCGITQDGE